MRTAEEEHIIQYIRLHKRLDDILTLFSEKTGMRRATACTWILRQYTDGLINEIPITEITPDIKNRFEIGETYYITQGRKTDGSTLGRGMRITMEKSLARRIDLISLQSGVPVGNLRCAMTAEYFHSIGML